MGFRSEAYFRIVPFFSEISIHCFSFGKKFCLLKKANQNGQDDFKKNCRQPPTYLLVFPIEPQACKVSKEYLEVLERRQNVIVIV
jgi:hypothetical protein